MVIYFASGCKALPCTEYPVCVQMLNGGEGMGVVRGSDNCVNCLNSSIRNRVLVVFFVFPEHGSFDFGFEVMSATL